MHIVQVHTIYCRILPLHCYDLHVWNVQYKQVIFFVTKKRFIINKNTLYFYKFKIRNKKSKKKRMLVMYYIFSSSCILCYMFIVPILSIYYFFFFLNQQVGSTIINLKKYSRLLYIILNVYTVKLTLNVNITYTYITYE